MFPRSIRWRLQLWHALILVVVLAGFGFTAFRLQRATELRRADEGLERRAGLLLKILRDGRPPGRSGSSQRQPPPGAFRITPEQEATLTEANCYYAVWRRDGEPMAISTNAPADIPVPVPPADPRTERIRRERDSAREVIHITPPGECVLVGRSIAPEQAGLRRFALWLAGLGAAVLVLGLGGGYWLASRAIRPIDQISAAAARISTGDLSHRIDAADTDNELDRLASVLNSTFARLEAAFNQQARFTSDASHELRTPVSVILTQTQTALARERPPAEYRDALEACQRAAQRMRRLTDALLELARIDAGEEKFRREAVNLPQVIEDAIAFLRPLADERKVTFRRDLQPVACAGDTMRLSQVAVNLITNAILHNRVGGEIVVRSAAEGDVAHFTVEDNGPGISAADLPLLFERFHRADKSRTGATGGTGLGLAITKAIVEAHGGRIEVTSEPARRTAFIVTLSAAADDGAAR